MNKTEQFSTNTLLEHERDLLLVQRGELLLSFVEAAQKKKRARWKEYSSALGRLTIS
jgi:hypothetical protein